MKKRIVMTRKISQPYIELLYAQIGNRNFGVYKCESRLDLLKGLKKAAIIHLHWIEGYFFVPHHKHLTLLKSLVFISYLIFVRYVARRKIVITLHNLVPHRMLYPVLEYRMFAFTLKLADGVIVHNNYSQKMACRMYNIGEDKIRVIPHGNFSLYYPNHISKEEARSKLKIPKNKFVMLSFGGIRKNKGLEELLDVLEELSVYEKDLFIIIAGACGDAALAKRLKEFSNKFGQSSLVRTEYIPDEDIQILMNASDVGILPYREITTSGALLLYMSFKKPVIVADLEPIEELLQDSGIYYKHGDSEDLAKVILGAKRGSYNLVKLAQEVFEISQKYQWNDIADKTVEFYDDLLFRSSK